MGPLTKEIMLSALLKLDQTLDRRVEMVLGGGGAMILAHAFPHGTTDIDAIPVHGSIDISELDVLVKKIAAESNLPTDWLNPYFSTFSHTLPLDYETRLIIVFEGKHLRVRALGREEMLIMKCFAHRPKDIGHARALIRSKADIHIVESRLEELLQKRIPGAQTALDFLQEVLELEGA